MTTTYNASTAQYNADLLEHLHNLIGLTIIVDRANFPKYSQKYDELKGICIGGCIVNGRNANVNGMPWKIGDEIAHAHSQSANIGYPEYEKYNGWICLRKKFYMSKMTMLHEIAHLYCKNIWHDDRFRKVLLSMGGTLDETRYGIAHHKIARKN